MRTIIFGPWNKNAMHLNIVKCFKPKWMAFVKFSDQLSVLENFSTTHESIYAISTYNIAEEFNRWR